MQDDESSGLGGCLVGLFLTVPLPIIFSYVNWFATNKTIQIVLLAIALIITFRIAYKYSRENNLTSKIIAIFILSVNIIFFFGIVYFAVFLKNPLSFRLADDFKKSTKLESVAELEDELQTHVEDSFFINLLLANYDVVFNNLKNPEVINEPNGTLEKSNFKISNGYKFNYHKMMGFTTGAQLKNGIPPMAYSSISISHSDSTKKVFRINNIIFAKSPDIRNELGRGLLGSQTEDQMKSFLINHRDSFNETKESILEKMQKSLLTSEYLEMNHFMFYSLSLVTTIGSNDISPNNGTSRLIVSLQAMISVFFFAYALTLLWPEIKTKVLPSKAE